MDWSSTLGLVPCWESVASRPSLFNLFERGTFVHRQVVGFVALDQVLRLLLRGVNGVPFELDLGRDFFLIVPRTRPASEFHST